MSPRLPLAILAAAILSNAAAAHADVTLAKVLSDHMVLQRDRAVPIWGKALPAEKVTVTFGKSSLSTTADAQGHWQIALPTGPANATGTDLLVEANNKLTLHDVLVGEVWICSGQSNMEYPLNRTFLNGTPPPPAGVKDISTEEYKTAHEPLIRTLKVERQLNTPDLPTDGWHECGGTSLQHFSAIGYYFGKELHAELKVPIGLIQSAWAGSRIEPWTPADAYKDSPLQADAAKTPGRLDGSPVGNYYSKIVAPLAPFAVRGVIWYQGESNIITTNDGMRYFDKFAAMVNAWRRDWHDPEMTFIQIQLAPYAYSIRKPSATEAAHPVTALPELWEAQETAARKIPHVGMVVINDLADNLTNIHPWNKWEVGHRLAQMALATEYHRDIEYTGPIFESVEFKGPDAFLTFSHAGAGLKFRDGKPSTDFVIAGADGKFVPATAEILDRPNADRQQIKVSAPAIKDPKSVRYAWGEIANPKLINSAGLPAGAFRTDAPTSAK